ncbi:hypothetical protein [Burkholderia sp. PAMC 26561]|uniref:hypothetical protein n=1 Tax=Burkholderia sp. PAMC 26561 TaxID=1795043 RepID=UPI00076B3C8D|nr:hypothetical protein [Burkholderia sp. PAMC 26561]AME28635.1 hypothetical protein AXG89_33130 [Burkholderia sp. PAMC 26561]
MSAVPQETPEDKVPAIPAASPNAEIESGLKPLARLTSDDRIARIIPDTHAQTELQYYSKFAREFLRAHYYFCSAKMSVARGGKRIAIEEEFRVADEWFKRALAQTNKLPRRNLGMKPKSVTVEMKNALSGRLVRLLSIYDVIFLRTLEGLFLGVVSAHQRQSALAAAEARLHQFPFICIPDSDRYAPEGVLLPDPDKAS